MQIVEVTCSKFFKYQVASSPIFTELDKTKEFSQLDEKPVSTQIKSVVAFLPVYCEDLKAFLIQFRNAEQRCSFLNPIVRSITDLTSIRSFSLIAFQFFLIVKAHQVSCN